MAKIITDKEKIEELLTRGVEKIYPDKKSLAAALSAGKKLRLYCGYDPSAPALHIGHAISLKKLGEFQALGHEVIFLIGDFTGMIGDPTDKSAARKKLSREEVLANARQYANQAKAYLRFQGDNSALVKYNSEWQDRLTFRELIEITSCFTVQQMIQRDMFQERLKAERPIFLHEFLYPVAQGYDSVAMDVDLEVGGNDQMFNMMCGRDLQRAINNKEKFVLTMKLLADEKGAKMGKTEGNALFLDVSPENMYGVVMSWPDGILVPAMELCTNVAMAEVEKIREKLQNGQANPRDIKMRLAREITAINHDQEKAQTAEAHFVRTVQKKEVPEAIMNYELGIANMKLIDLLVEIKFASSKTDARRLIEQGGVKVGGEAIKDINAAVDIPEAGVLIQKGKLKFLRVVRR